jgi:ferredoxin
MDISRVNGVPVRDSVASRYRQWLTHKLATWQDQFGTSGCVGCGRCITWCPPGIDLTQEVWTLQQLARNGGHGTSDEAANEQTVEIGSEEG